MPVFAANLSFLFTELSFLDRFDAAADAGFTAVEYMFPYEEDPEAVAVRLAANKLTCVLFNLPPGDWAAGERGLAALPEAAARLREGIDTALRHAEAAGTKRLHLMAGIADRNDPKACRAYEEALVHTAGQLEPKGITLLIEPINRRDMPGYFLDDFAYAAALIERLNLPNLKLQFDIYHRQILHGDVAMALRQLMPLIGHIQVASVPSRHEPVSEELNAAFLFDEIDRLGYDGFIGCEYRPRAGTRAGLSWLTALTASKRD